MPSPKSMVNVINAVSRELSYQLNQTKLKKQLTEDTLPEFRSAFLKMMDGWASAEVGEKGYKTFAHLYELGHEGNPNQRLFSTAFTNGNFAVYLKEAKLHNPLTDWQREYYGLTAIKSKYIWPKRPFVVEEGLDFTIWPDQAPRLVLGTELDGSYKQPGTKPIIMDYVNQEYSTKPSKNAMAKALDTFASTYGARILIKRTKVEIDKVLTKTMEAARLAYI